MALTVTTTFTVADQAPVTAAAAAVVLPPVGFAAGGKGQLGGYDYVVTPDDVVNAYGDVFYPPLFQHTQTIGGAIDTMWPGYVRDARVVERWRNGDVGCPIDHLLMLWQLLASHPDISSGSGYVWAPNYMSNRRYNVALYSLRAGGQDITIDLRLAKYGYAPGPVELEMRILGYA